MLLIIPVSADSIEVTELSIAPQKLLVGDTAECTLKLHNPNSETIEITSIQFNSPSGLSAEPKSVLDVGHVPPQSSYTLPFYVEAEEAGKYSVEVEVHSRTSSGLTSQTVYQRMNVIVEDDMPEISFNQKIKLNEVNDMGLEVASPIEISNVRIVPLFDTEQKSIYFNSIENSAQKTINFYGEEQDYKFKISFYNGNNYHSFVQEVDASYSESQGLFANVSVPYSSVYLYDVIPIKVGLSNLRDDTLYDISLTANSQLGEFSESSKDVAKLGPDDTKKLTLLYSPTESGQDTINLNIAYEDSMSNSYEYSVSRTVKILDEASMSVTGVNIEAKTTGGTSTGQQGGPGIFRGGASETSPVTTQATISGDVSNNGWSEALNAYVYVDLGGSSESYFVGSIDPSDFQSFSIPVTGNERTATVKLVWTNQLGEKVEVDEEFNVAQSMAQVTGVQRTEQTPIWMYVVPLIGAAIVVAFLYRRRKQNREEYEE